MNYAEQERKDAQRAGDPGGSELPLYPSRQRQRERQLDPPYRDSEDPQNKGGGNDPAFYRIPNGFIRREVMSREEALKRWPDSAEKINEAAGVQEYVDSDDPQNIGGGNDPAFYRPATRPIPTTYPDDLPCVEKAVRELEDTKLAFDLLTPLSNNMGLPWRVDYDGPSRPIILTSHVPPRMFSFDELNIGTKCGSFDEEVAWAEQVVAAINQQVVKKESK